MSGVGHKDMLATSHCTVHPSRDAGQRCRSCGCWLCERCALTTPRGIFCSNRCRRRFSLLSTFAGLRRLATNPLEGPWVIGLVGGLIALLIAGVGMLASRLVEVSQPAPLQAPIQTFRLVETGAGLDVTIEGPPGRHVIVVDPSGRPQTITFDSEGKTHLIGIFTPPPTIIREPTPQPIRPQQAPIGETPMTPRPTRVPTSTPPQQPTPRVTATPVLKPIRIQTAPHT